MQIVVKLKDVIIDPAKPMDLTAMPAERAIELLRKAYGFLAANMTFEIRDEMVVIAVDYERRQDEEIAKDCFDRGMEQAKSGQYTNAADMFTRTLKIVPEHVEARRNLAIALKNADRLAEAKDHLVDVLRLSPEDSWAYVLLGNIYAWYEKDAVTAERYYRRALESASHDTGAASNYAALKIEREDCEGARVVAEQMITADPKDPTPYHELAAVLYNASRTEDALAALERMFDATNLKRVRTADTRKRYREFLLRVSFQFASAEHDRIWKHVLALRDEVAGITGFPVEIVEDISVKADTATTVPSWNAAGARTIRYFSWGTVLPPYVVARELVGIRMAHEAERAGKLFDLAYVGDNPEGAKAIEEHVRDNANGDAKMRDVVAQAMDTIVGGLLLVPIDALIERRLWDHLPEIRPSQLVGLDLLVAAKKREAYARVQTDRALPALVKRAYVAGAAAEAIFIDRMCGGRTAYAEDYVGSPAFPLARKLAESWHKAFMDFHPGDEYVLVRQFFQALGLGAWLGTRQSARQ